MPAPRHVVGSLLLAAAGATDAQPRDHVNMTAGGPLRPGVYGRIEVRSAPPPPVLSPRPVVAWKEAGSGAHEPVYLYVPAGHVRRWSQHCHRYDACGRPVYFVRMDDAPFKLGSWKQRSRTMPGAPGAVASAGSPF